MRRRSPLRHAGESQHPGGSQSWIPAGMTIVRRQSARSRGSEDNTIMTRTRLLRILCALVLVVGARPLAQQKPLRAPDVPFDPSPHTVVEQMLKLADIRKTDVVYDLGCGDGRIVIAAARQYGARGVGIDIDPQRIKESQQNARTAGVAGRVAFRNEDLFEADIAEATVVTLFLWPEVNLKLRPKLLADLKPGTRVVSYYWDMGEWQPERQIEINGHSIYLWTIPARRPPRPRPDA
jgi:SAM-dependent methyltransferase